MSKARKNRKGRQRSRRAVSLKMTGDHGTGTGAATRDTELVPHGTGAANPNRVAHRKRVNRVEWLAKHNVISERQHWAGKKIQEAHGRVEMLSSGGELKEQVQSSPKPDATIDIQCDAMSRLVHVMAPLRGVRRQVVELIIWENKRLGELQSKYGLKRGAALLREGLDAVADHLSERVVK